MPIELYQAAPLIDDQRHVGVGLDVVQIAGLVMDALVDGVNIFSTRLAGLALDAGHQGGTLSADKCAATLADLHVKIKSLFAQNILAQQAAGARLFNRMGEEFQGQGIFMPHIDEALTRTDPIRDCISRDDQSFEDGVRIALEHGRDP